MEAGRDRKANIGRPSRLTVIGRKKEGEREIKTKITEGGAVRSE